MNTVDVTTTIATTVAQTTATPTNHSSFAVVITVVVVATGILLLALAAILAVAVRYLFRKRNSRSKQVVGSDGLPISGNTVYENLGVEDDSDSVKNSNADGGTVYLDDEESGVYYSTIKDL